jgi:hypothetical protein
LADVVDKECIIYADIDISEMIMAKQYHDIIGHYTRMDVVSLNLSQDEDRPIWYTSRMGASAGLGVEVEAMSQLREIQRGYQSVMEELKGVVELFSQAAGELKRGKTK